MLLTGLVIFTAASFVCGAAGNVALLNAARALQGVGAALQLSSALAILSHEFRGAERARAFAFWGAVVGIAISLGPVAGGFITETLGWEWAFYVNLPVGLTMIALSVINLTESRDLAATRIDISGFVSFTLFLFLTTLALISGNRSGWTSLAILLECAGAVILFTIFITIETLQRQPMLDLGFFRRPTYIGANIASVAFAATMLAMLSYLPIYLQSGLGYGAQTAGLLMLPMAIPLFLMPRVVVAQLTHRLTGRALLTIGLCLVSAGLLWMGLEAPRFEYWMMLGGMLVAGTGAGILNGEVAKVSMTVIPPERAGMASGVGGTARFSGVVVGFAALGAVLFTRVSHVVAAGLPSALPADRLALVRNVTAGDLSGSRHALALASFGAGYQAILLVAAMIAATAALLSWLLIRASETAAIPRHGRGISGHVSVVE